VCSGPGRRGLLHLALRAPLILFAILVGTPSRESRSRPWCCDVLQAHVQLLLLRLLSALLWQWPTGVMYIIDLLSNMAHP
jgi:hypothetical protein